MQDVWARALSYFRRRGARQSIRLVQKKLTGQVPWNVRSPAVSTERYIQDHAAAADNNQAVRRSRGGPPAYGANLFAVPNVALIGDLNLPQCKKFRVIQKMEALRDMGLRSEHSHWQDVPRSVNLLQTATHVIFYRVTDTELFHAYAGEARRLGLAISYDIDDPIFDESIYGSNENLEHLESGEREQLLLRCRQYLAAMRACDNIIVSTPGLKALAEAKCGKPTFLWRNAIDAETMQAAKLAEDARSKRERDAGIVVGYASGSRAHGADFVAAEEAVAALLEKDPDVRLVIAGMHEPSAKLVSFGDRVTFAPFTDYETYIATVAGFDLNLVPLVQDGFNDCKSAIRFLDAAVVGVPSIASNTGDFVNVIEHGKTGFIADGGESWLPLLECLAGDPALRLKTGQAARQFALTEMTAVNVARHADPALLAQFGNMEFAA